MTNVAEALALVRDELGGKWQTTVCVHDDQFIVLPDLDGEFHPVGPAPALVKDGKAYQLPSSPLEWPSWYLDTDDDDLVWVEVKKRGN